MFRVSNFIASPLNQYYRTSHALRSALTMLGVYPPPSPSSGAADSAGGTKVCVFTASQLRAAYLKRALDWHPDRHEQSPAATARFQQLTEALRYCTDALNADGTLYIARLYRPEEENNDETAAWWMAGGETHHRHRAPDASIQLKNALDTYETERRQFKKQGGQHSPSDPHPHSSEPAGYFALEALAEVCVDEHKAAAKLLSFGDGLAEILCGRKTFEVFFLPREACVLRGAADAITGFSNRLPNIVSRVVRARPIGRGRLKMDAPQYPIIRSRLMSAENTTVGSTEGPFENSMAAARTYGVVDDLGLKPLVLLGALAIKVVPYKVGSAAAADNSRLKQQPQPLDKVLVACRPGAGEDERDRALLPLELQCTPELCCVLQVYPNCGASSAALDEWVRKLSAWETRSYDRLVHECALSFAAQTVSAELGLRPPLTITPILRLPEEVAARAGRVLSQMACEIVCAADDDFCRRLPLGCQGRGQALPDQQEGSTDDNSAPTREGHRHSFDDGGDESPDDSIISQGAAASPLGSSASASTAAGHDGEELERPTCIASDALIQRPQLIVDIPAHIASITISYDRTILDNSDEGNCEDCRKQDGYTVRRASNCCRLEDQKYDVTISLWDEPFSAFHRRLCAALADVRHRVRRGHRRALVGVPLRESLVNNAVAVHRLRCVARVYGAEPEEELLLWTRLKAAAPFLYPHQPHMGHWNVHFAPAGSPEAKATGWCGDSADGDKVTIGASDLASDEAFMGWLREIVAQSTLAKQARDIVFEHGIPNISRHPTLHLPRYIGFLNNYATCAARHVLERPSPSAARAHVDTHGFGTSPSHFGVLVTAESYLAVRAGVLQVPWDIDPAQLVRVLGGGSEEGGVFLPQLSQRAARSV